MALGIPQPRIISAKLSVQTESGEVVWDLVGIDIVIEQGRYSAAQLKLSGTISTDAQTFQLDTAVREAARQGLERTQPPVRHSKRKRNRSRKWG